MNDNCKDENNLSSEELNALKTLMQNKNIVIQKVDKGNTVVITDKEKYIQGVKNVISDTSKFTPLNRSPDSYLNYIVNVEKKIKKVFNDLHDNVKMSCLKFLP